MRSDIENFKVIVLDNNNEAAASGDGSQDDLDPHHPDGITIMQSPTKEKNQTSFNNNKLSNMMLVNEGKRATANQD